MGVIAFFAFWMAVVYAWIYVGPKLSLIFVGLWVCSLLVSLLVFNNSYLHMSITAFLAALLMALEKIANLPR